MNNKLRAREPTRPQICSVKTLELTTVQSPVLVQSSAIKQTAVGITEAQVKDILAPSP